MGRNTSRSVVLLVGCAALCLVLPGVASAAEILGQVASSGMRVEGLSAPSGATLMSPSLLATGDDPGIVYLSNGRTLAIGPRTEVSLAAKSAAEVEVAVHVGEVAFRGADGAVRTVGSAGAFVLDQEEVIGEGRRVTGLVGVLTASALAGDTLLQVDRTDGIDVSQKVLIRTPDGAVQEVHCIDTANQEAKEVELKEPLSVNYPQGAQLIQGAPVQQALESGEAEDLCGLPAAAWSSQKKLAVGAAAVLGAFALVDFGDGEDAPTRDAEEVSKRRP